MPGSASLLQRLWDPTEGRVTVGGVDVRTLRLGDLRGGIATVAQDPVLFSGPLRDNILYILYGRPEASEAEVMAAVRDANLEAFVARLPDGLETVVDARGVKVSGGERERVAIARAILTDPAILIPAEATSHLDGESERLVQGALDRLIESRTTLVIAHRLSTIRGASQFVVVDGGRSARRGRHDELIAAPGLYAELQRLAVSGEDATRPPREE